MNNRLARVQAYFEEKGYVVEDMQMNDPSVGIPQGYVSLLNKYEDQLEIAWDDAEYHASHKTSKKVMKKDIKPFKE